MALVHGDVELTQLEAMVTGEEEVGVVQLPQLLTSRASPCVKTISEFSSGFMICSPLI